jgi:hypothetical protein
LTGSRKDDILSELLTTEWKVFEEKQKSFEKNKKSC